MIKTYYISGPFTGTHKEFVDEHTLNIRNRLNEVYGETLPRELDEQIPYIVGEIYNATRNHCAQVWNVESEKGW